MSICIIFMFIAHMNIGGSSVQKQRSVYIGYFYCKMSKLSGYQNAFDFQSVHNIFIYLRNQIDNRQKFKIDFWWTVSSAMIQL